MTLPNTSALSTDDRLAVRPATACRMLDVGMTRLYELLNGSELESYLDGRSRKITVSSIRAYVARRAAAGAPPVATSRQNTAA